MSGHTCRGYSKRPLIVAADVSRLTFSGFEKKLERTHVAATIRWRRPRFISTVKSGFQIVKFGSDHIAEVEASNVQSNGKPDQHDQQNDGRPEVALFKMLQRTREGDQPEQCRHNNHRIHARRCQ